MSNLDNPRRTLISPDNLVPLGVAAACVLALVTGAVGGYTWLDTQFDDMNLSVREVKSDTAAVREDVNAMRALLSDRLTKSEFQNFMELFFARNPQLTSVTVR